MRPLLNLLLAVSAALVALSGCGGSGSSETALPSPVAGTMIDIHNHILPGLDDGAKSRDEAVAMARLAVTDGIGTIIATPHWDATSRRPSPASINAALQTIRTALAAEEVHLRLEAGAEVALKPEVLEAADAGELPTMVNSRYVLVELIDSVDWTTASQIVFGLIKRGYKPILAHPEISLQMAGGIERVLQLRSKGALIQITAASLAGFLGQDAQRWANELLAETAVDLIATDAHRPLRTLTSLELGRQAVSDILGPKAFEQMTVTTPTAILEGDRDRDAV